MLDLAESTLEQLVISRGPAALSKKGKDTLIVFGVVTLAIFVFHPEGFTWALLSGIGRGIHLLLRGLVLLPFLCWKHKCIAILIIFWILVILAMRKKSKWIGRRGGAHPIQGHRHPNIKRRRQKKSHRRSSSSSAASSSLPSGVDNGLPPRLRGTSDKIARNILPKHISTEDDEDAIVDDDEGSFVDQDTRSVQSFESDSISSGKLSSFGQQQEGSPLPLKSAAALSSSISSLSATEAEEGERLVAKGEGDHDAHQPASLSSAGDVKSSSNEGRKAGGGSSNSVKDVTAAAQPGSPNGGSGEGGRVTGTTTARGKQQQQSSVQLKPLLREGGGAGGGKYVGNEMAGGGGGGGGSNVGTPSEGAGGGSRKGGSSGGHHHATSPAFTSQPHHPHHQKGRRSGGGPVPYVIVRPSASLHGSPSSTSSTGSSSSSGSGNSAPTPLNLYQSSPSSSCHNNVVKSPIVQHQRAAGLPHHPQQHPLGQSSSSAAPRSPIIYPSNRTGGKGHWSSGPHYPQAQPQPSSTQHQQQPTYQTASVLNHHHSSSSSKSQEGSAGVVYPKGIPSQQSRRVSVCGGGGGGGGKPQQAMLRPPPGLEGEVRGVVGGVAEASSAAHAVMALPTTAATSPRPIYPPHQHHNINVMGSGSGSGSPIPEATAAASCPSLCPPSMKPLNGGHLMSSPTTYSARTLGGGTTTSSARSPSSFSPSSPTLFPSYREHGEGGGEGGASHQWIKETIDDAGPATGAATSSSSSATTTTAAAGGAPSSSSSSVVASTQNANDALEMSMMAIANQISNNILEW